MEQEIMMTGIGGQGIQLAAQILARAAIQAGKHVLYLGTYGGTMRGGNTDATLVLSDERITSPPIVSQVGTALAMHPAFYPALERKLRPSATVVLNGSLFDSPTVEPGQTLHVIPVTDLATKLGEPMAASMILIGAWAALAGGLPIEALLAGMRESVPEYRKQHIRTNEIALRTGFEEGTA
jgi:Pyruvate/2-oxoacid:ferredoxin oxidoreductase gamma subunit